MKTLISNLTVSVIVGLCLPIALVSYAQAQTSAPTAATPAAPVPATPLPAAPAPAAKATLAPKAAMANNSGESMVGKISYYGAKFNGRKTASGERFNSNAMTMAHKTLPFGTLVKVTNPKNKRSVVVRVNDRGPSTPDRIGDLSRAAAVKVGIIKAGVSEVSLKVVGKRGAKKAKAKKTKK